MLDAFPVVKNYFTTASDGKQESPSKTVSLIETSL